VSVCGLVLVFDAPQVVRQPLAARATPLGVRWRCVDHSEFGAKTEAMTAEQRRLFEETVAEEEAALQAQIAALQGRCDVARGGAGGHACRF
jgi:hypothetical protein